MKSHIVNALLPSLLSFLLVACASPNSRNNYKQTVSLAPKINNIVICMDGTWNIKDNRTNVQEVYRLCSDAARQRPSRALAVYYDTGVGSDFRKITGGGMGVGHARNIREAYEFAARHYTPGCKIYIFGFSRGAFSARVLAACFEKCGMLNYTEYGNQKNWRNAVEEIYKTYKDKACHETVDCGFRFRDIWAKRDNQKLHFHKGKPDIQFLGLWDTVGSLGIKQTDQERKYACAIQDLPHVRHAAHAVSLHEQRSNFSLIGMSKDGRANPRLDEVWFGGVHSDIGGGYDDVARCRLNSCSRSLADISLHWMLGHLSNDTILPSSYQAASPTELRRIAQNGKIHDSDDKMWRFLGVVSTGKSHLPRTAPPRMHWHSSADIIDARRKDELPPDL
jgi:uncharacterized protein (DUF2235 family)